MKAPLVSVIVPVYNAQSYLHRCIESVLVQTMTDFELILVDDGSTDRSLAICTDFARKDQRIKLISKENGGVSTARNLGLDVAVGKWVIFLDSDDFWLQPTILEQLIHETDQLGLDIVRAEYISVNENEQPIFHKDYSSKTSFQHQKLSPATFLKEIVKGEFFLVLCLIRRQCIAQLRFDTNQVFLEDMKFFMSLLLQPMNCGYLQSDFYAYRKIASSASNSYNIRKLSDSFGMTQFFSSLALNSKDNDFIQYCQYYAVMMYCWTLQTVSEDPYFQHRRIIIEQIGLNQIRHFLLGYLKDNSIAIAPKYQLVLHLKPHLGVLLYRFNTLLYQIIRK